MVSPKPPSKKSIKGKMTVFLDGSQYEKTNDFIGG